MISQEEIAIYENNAHLLIGKIFFYKDQYNQAITIILSIENNNIHYLNKRKEVNDERRCTVTITSIINWIKTFKDRLTIVGSKKIITI